MTPSLESILCDTLMVLAFLLALVYVCFKWKYQYWRNRNVSQIDPKIPFGNLGNPLTAIFSESVSETYRKARQEGWKYCGLYILLFPCLLIVDLDLVKNVLSKDFQHFMDRGTYTNEKDDPIGCHLYALRGARWRKLRAKLTPTFTTGRLKTMFQTLVDCGMVLEKYVEGNIKPREPVDIQEILACFSTDVIGSCAFGLECNSFKEPDSAFRRFGKKVFNVSKPAAFKMMFCQNFPNIARALGLRQIAADVSEFFTGVVNDTVTYREKNNVVRKDFLQLLMEIRNTKDGQQNVAEDGSTLTMDEIVSQSFVFFMAGFETSSTTMTFALFELAMHPDIQERLRDEIDTVLVRHDDKITYDSVNEMKYLEQVIDETQRLHSPGRFLSRECTNDYKVPGEDFTIEKGTILFIPVRAIHHDEEYWENPKEFDPERFSEEKKKSMNPYIYMPFGQGPRICIGDRFGLAQIKMGLICLLRKFRVKLDKKTMLPLRISTNSIVYSCEGKIWLNLEKI